MRLDKFLGSFDIGTRKQIKDYLKNGRCTVNGEVVYKPDVHIDENTDEIAFDGNVLEYAKFHYFMLYKPAGVITATYDGKTETVLDLLSGENVKDLSPAGRLDIDTEGLVLITDDGALIHRLLSPKKHVDKVYEVHLRERLSDKDIKRLEEGLDIGDLKDNGEKDLTLPAKVELYEDDEKGRPVVHLIIHEGRFHQIKRMMEAVGNEVLFLKRLSMGPLVLDEALSPGEYRPLTKKELEALGV
jgi:16S rRNA pseudouridine516 synthase